MPSNYRSGHAQLSVIGSKSHAHIRVRVRVLPSRPPNNNTSAITMRPFTHVTYMSRSYASQSGLRSHPLEPRSHCDYVVSDVTNDFPTTVVLCTML